MPEGHLDIAWLLINTHKFYSFKRRLNPVLLLVKKVIKRNKKCESLKNVVPHSIGQTQYLVYAPPRPNPSLYFMLRLILKLHFTIFSFSK